MIILQPFGVLHVPGCRQYVPGSCTHEKNIGLLLLQDQIYRNPVYTHRYSILPWVIFLIFWRSSGVMKVVSEAKIPRSEKRFI